MITSKVIDILNQIGGELLGVSSATRCPSPKETELFERLEAEIDLYLRKINAKYYKNGLDEFFWD